MLYTIQATTSNSGGYKGTAKIDSISIVNTTIDGAAPTFSSADTSTDGTKVILTYNESLSYTTAAISAFTVTTDGNANAVTAVAVSGSIVELNLTDTVKNDQTVTVALPIQHPPMTPMPFKTLLVMTRQG